MARVGVMLAKPYEERFLNEWPNLFYAQPKYNGRRARAIAPHGKYVLLSSEARTLPSCSHIEAQLDKCFEGYSTKPSFDGEIYVHGMSIQNLGSLVSVRNNITEASQALEYHIFDMIYEAQQEDRILLLDMLKARLELHHSIHVSPYFNIVKGDINGLLHNMLEEGFEGIVLRNPLAFYQPRRTHNLLKIKPRYQDDYTILEAFEAIAIDGSHKGMLGGLVLKSEEGDIFKSGAGTYSHEQREYLWRTWKNSPELLKGQIATVKYQELSDRKVPLQPILVKISGIEC